MFGQFNTIDWLILAILIFSILLGFIRGALSNAIPFFIIIFALYLAAIFKDFFTGWLDSYFNNLVVSNIAAYLICVILIISAAKLFKYLLKIVLDITGIGFIDRPLGALIALTKTVLFLWLILALVYLSPLSNYAIYHQSQIINTVEPELEWLVTNTMAVSIRDIFDKSVSENFDNQKAQVYEAIIENSADIKAGTLKQIDRISE